MLLVKFAESKIVTRISSDFCDVPACRLQSNILAVYQIYYIAAIGHKIRQGFI